MNETKPDRFPVTLTCGPVVAGTFAVCVVIVCIAACWAHVVVVEGYRVSARGELVETRVDGSVEKTGIRKDAQVEKVEARTEAK